MGLGQQDLSKLLEYYKDRYDPAELVEHLDMSIEDLLSCIESWLEEDHEVVQEDLEHITKFEED